MYLLWSEVKKKTTGEIEMLCFYGNTYNLQFVG